MRSSMKVQGYEFNTFSDRGTSHTNVIHKRQKSAIKPNNNEKMMIY